MRAYIQTGVSFHLSWKHVMNIKITVGVSLELLLYIYIYIYLLTAIGLSPGGSTHLHTKNT